MKFEIFIQFWFRLSEICIGSKFLVIFLISDLNFQNSYFFSEHFWMQKWYLSDEKSKKSCFCAFLCQLFPFFTYCDRFYWAIFHNKMLRFFWNLFSQKISKDSLRLPFTIFGRSIGARSSGADWSAVLVGRGPEKYWPIRKREKSRWFDWDSNRRLPRLTVSIKILLAFCRALPVIVAIRLRQSVEMRARRKLRLVKQ